MSLRSVVVALLFIAVAAPLATADAAPVARKDVQDLTPRERRDFTNAVVALKHERSPFNARVNYYDQFVRWHADRFRCTPGKPNLIAHGGPMFLPWHRSFLLAFEGALRQVSGKRITVPYWDWSNAASTRSMLKLMGGTGDPDHGYELSTGPFRRGKFRIRVQPVRTDVPVVISPWITRKPGPIGPIRLPTAADDRSVLHVGTSYDVVPFDNRSDATESFRGALEGFRDPADGASVRDTCRADHFFHPPNPQGLLASSVMHNGVHTYVAGLIPAFRDRPAGFGSLQPETSPNDPIFFLLHSNVDRLWARWQVSHPALRYEPTNGLPLNEASSKMPPFDDIAMPSTPRAVERISKLGYRYRAHRRATASRILCPLFR